MTSEKKEKKRVSITRKMTQDTVVLFRRHLVEPGCTDEPAAGLLLPPLLFYISDHL